MNTRNQTSRNLTRSIAALAIAGLMALPTFGLAQEKGAQKLMELQKINTVAALQTVDAGDTIIMSCPKCKDTFTTVVEKTFKAASPEQLSKVPIHLCPACETKVVVKNQGKAAENVLVHTCKACGSKDVTCCVMKKGARSTPRAWSKSKLPQAGGSAGGKLFVIAALSGAPLCL